MSKAPCKNQEDDLAAATREFDEATEAANSFALLEPLEPGGKAIQITKGAMLALRRLSKATQTRAEKLKALEDCRKAHGL